MTNGLGKKSSAVGIVSKLLNFWQKQCCMDIAPEVLRTFNGNTDLLKKVIIGDEPWVYGYDPHTYIIGQYNPSVRIIGSEDCSKLAKI